MNLNVDRFTLEIVLHCAVKILVPIPLFNGRIHKSALCIHSQSFSFAYCVWFSVPWHTVESAKQEIVCIGVLAQSTYGFAWLWWIVLNSLASIEYSVRESRLGVYFTSSIFQWNVSFRIIHFFYLIVFPVRYIPKHNKNTWMIIICSVCACCFHSISLFSSCALSFTVNSVSHSHIQKLEAQYHALSLNVNDKTININVNKLTAIRHTVRSKRTNWYIFILNILHFGSMYRV